MSEQYVITKVARTSLLGDWTFRATPVKDGTVTVIPQEPKFETTLWALMRSGKKFRMHGKESKEGFLLTGIDIVED